MSQSSRVGTEEGESIKRPSLIPAMGRWTLTAAIVNAVIGSGIFGIPSQLAALVGPWSPLAVLLAGATMFVVILSFAEVSSRFTGPGGPYLYAREAFGPSVGFQVGWLMLLSRLLSSAAALNIQTAYLATLIPAVATPAGRAVAMTVAVASVTIVNVRGVRLAAWTTNVFTVAKLLPLVLLIGLAATKLSPAVMSSQVVDRADWGQALLLLVFAYGGFEAAVVAASEARDPKRDMPFALIAATAGVTVVYALLQVAVIGIVPSAGAGSTPIAAALGVLLGPPGVLLASGAVILSIYGWLTGFTLMMPRVVYSMASRGELPAPLAYVHPRFRTPALAIAVNAGLALALSLYSSFTQAAVLAAIARLLVFIATCASALTLRRHGPAPFRVPGGQIVAALGIAFSAWLLSTRSFAQAWMLLAAMAAGLAVRAWYHPRHVHSHRDVEAEGVSGRAEP